MAIFDKILEKLGMKKATLEENMPKPPVAPAKPVVTPPPAPVQGYTGTVAPTHEIPGHTAAGVPTTPAPAPKPVEMAHEDLVTHLDYLAKTGPIKGLNWRVSINDFMALLGMDHSPAAIKELAVELGCPEKEMMDSYTRNVWTHKALMQKLAENGGNVPPALLK
jgi:hypothetical protein